MTTLASLMAPTGVVTPNKAQVLTNKDLTSSTNTFPSSFAFVPTGAIFEIPGGVAPAGYLACNGAAVSRTTYSALFAVINTTSGSGDGSTTFNVPTKASNYIKT